ncbi:MAG TPA: hypothetical protein VF735_13930 [Pyrinomonadaceae bacterium]|jgi:hypothetical protein
MKRCPNCHRTYNDSLQFCLEDGTVLVSNATPKQEAETLKISSPSDASPTSEYICPDRWLHGIAEFDKQNINATIIVTEHKATPYLSSDIPIIELEFVVFNGSVYTVSADDIVKGYIAFNKQRLNSNNLELISNNIKRLLPNRIGQIRLSQQLTEAEVKLVSKGLEEDDATLFLSNLNIYIAGSYEKFGVESKRLDIPDAIPARDDAERIKILTKQYKFQISSWEKRADIIHRLSIVHGMALQADHTINFFHGSLSEDELKYLDSHINSTIHHCFGAQARDNYYETMNPLPESTEAQSWWIRAHCAKLEALIKQQGQLINRKSTNRS